MIVALGAPVLLGSIVDLLIFPKIVMKNVAKSHRKHDVYIVIITWKIVSTGASYLTTGTLCNVA